jgi:hypothetical protein
LEKNLNWLWQNLVETDFSITETEFKLWFQPNFCGIKPCPSLLKAIIRNFIHLQAKISVNFHGIIPRQYTEIAGGVEIDHFLLGNA